MFNDLRYAWRGMRKAPVFTLFGVLTLGLGIGANTTVFTIVNTLLLHPLPVRDPSRLVALYDSGSKGEKMAAARLPLAYANFQDYAARQASFRDVAAFTPPMVMTLRTDARPERVFGEFVGKQYFDTLGLRPAMGRFFMPAEDSTPGSAPVAVLSYNAWKARFGGASAAMGSTLELNNVVFTIVGVAPPGFLGISAIFGPDVWLPATMCERAFPAELRNTLADRGKPMFHAVGRLRETSTPQSAQADLNTITPALEREYPVDEGHGIAVRPITDELYSNAGGAGGFVFGSAVLLAMVGLILAIACANIANLLMARAAARGREIAVRLAVGAGRGRLIRQLLTESLLLSLFGFLAGVGVGYAGCRFVWSFVPAEVAGNMAAPKLDGAVLFLALAVSLATAFLFGLVPALRASKTDVVTGLKETAGAAGQSRRTVTFTNLLLAGQVAFSLICLVTALLFFRSIQRAYTIDPGFQSSHLALFMTNPAQAGYSDARVKEFYRAVRSRVANLPGVAAASWASGLPFWNTPSGSVAIEGAERRGKSAGIPSVVVTVDSNYWDTIGIPLAEGRAFGDSDTDGSLPVAMINEALARERWPGGNALDKRFQLTGEPVVRRVVGIVKNANYTTLGEAAQPCVYLPLRQNFRGGMVLYVRSRQAPAAVLAAVQRNIRDLDPDIQISDVRTGAKLIEQVLWGPRVGVALLGVFGSLALVLASVGLYGAMAYSVTRRRKEIGLRMALGASRAAVLRIVLRDGMSLVCYGIAAGLAACLLLGRALSRILFGLSPADPISLAAASLVLVAVALLACYLPARSATQIDPLAALRDQ